MQLSVWTVGTVVSVIVAGVAVRKAGAAVWITDAAVLEAGVAARVAG